MMNVCACGGSYKEAAQLFNEMQRDGLSPDSFTYLTLVRGYAAGKKYMEAEEAISLMKKQGGVGISPTCAHYNVLLSAYAKTGVLEDVERVYELLIAAGLTPDVACYQTMLRFYLDYGYVDKGVSLFESISDSGGAKSDRFIMSAAVHLYRAAGLSIKAQGVLTCMNSLGIPFLKIRLAK
ncbi:putative tetratricopeptide-like helical domain superfamily [Helianthus annuus]|nr:putative tetratricopeptide-like helical domain superfamily [Helianthus annuus]